MTAAPDNSQTAYLNTAEVFPQDQSQFLIKMTDTYTKTAYAVNVRQIGLYQEATAQLTGQQFSTFQDSTKNKFTYRKIFYFNAIAPGATLNIPHGITGLVQLTNLYGTCITNAVDYRPIPFADVGAVTNNIAIRATGGALGNVIIQNGATAPAITSGLVVIEYLLN